MIKIHEDKFIKNYLKRFSKETDSIKQLMKKTWGIAPKLETNIYPAIQIRTDFKMKGFAHDGKLLTVSDLQAKYHRKPEYVARMFMRELTAHRNTCKECGENTPTLWQRFYFGKELIWALEKLRFIITKQTPRKDRKHRWQSIASNDNRDNLVKYISEKIYEVKKERGLLTAPDDVEKKLHPLYSNRIKSYTQLTQNPEFIKIVNESKFKKEDRYNYTMTNIKLIDNDEVLAKLWE